MIFITPSEALRKSAEAIRQHRIRQSLTQEDLARKSGVALATLRKFERTGLISLESFFKLATVLGILDEIMDCLETQEQPASLDDLLKQDKKTKRMRVRASKIS